LKRTGKPITVPIPTRPPSLTQLFLAFLRLGLTAFGGPAMVSFIRKMAVQDKHWLDEDTFRGGVALCQTIPGATAMQTTAYVGLQLRGVRGAAASFVGFGLPAFLLMFGLSFLYARYHSLPAVTAVFGGLRALIVALLAHAYVTFGRSYLKRWRNIIIVAIAASLFWFGLTPVLVVVVAAVLGIGVSFRTKEAPRAASVVQARFRKIPLLAVLSFAALCLIFLLVFDRRLFQLSLLMMKIDLFAFGGGFASIPLMLHDVVDVRQWMDQHVFMDGIALGQITPGPVVITSTFVGYIARGPLGAVIAALSIFLPSFVMVIATAPFFARLNAFPLFRKAVGGILCSFVGLLVVTAVRLCLAVPWTISHVMLSAAAFAALMLRVDLIWVIVSGAALSLLIG
jgi:chromate transporter